MRILLIIENIAERNRMVRGLDGGLHQLVAKSVNDVYDYISQFQFDVIVCDLVFGNLTASELFERVSKECPETPRFLCLLSDQSLTNAEITSLRSMQENDSVDVMKKPIVSAVLDSYFQNLLDLKDECGDCIDSDAVQPRETETADTSQLERSSPSQNNVRDEIHRLDCQHKELATTVSMLQQKVAALEKGMPELANTLDSD